MNRPTEDRIEAGKRRSQTSRTKPSLPLPSFRWLLGMSVAVFLGFLLPQPSQGYYPEVTVEYDLGNPCIESHEKRHAPERRNALNNSLLEARENENWPRAIKLQKKRLRYRCWDAERWLNLSESLHRAGNDTEALKILSELYEDAPNWFEQLLLHESRPFLNTIVNSPAYESSRLKQLRQRDIRDWRNRRQQFRTKLRTLPDHEKPSDPYVARDVCPFECCIYRTWSVHGSVPLYEKPRTDTRVARLEVGDTVAALTGHVYLRPDPVGVVHDVTVDRATSIPAGDLVFVLDYVGEGYSQVYYNGETYSLMTHELQTRCPRPDESCWGEYLNKERGQHQWWVKLSTPQGVTAWTNRVELFGNKDQCG